MMLREYTYLFNVAIKSLNKLFNSATCRQTYASIMERQEVCQERSTTTRKFISKGFQIKVLILTLTLLTTWTWVSFSTFLSYSMIVFAPPVTENTFLFMQ